MQILFCIKVGIYELQVVTVFYWICFNDFWLR